MKLWIITVNFGDIAPTVSLIDSLAPSKKNDSIIIGIADNSASDKSTSELKNIIDKSKFDIRLFSYEKNFYYWPAVNKVIENLKNLIGNYPDWVVVCNNDITFPDKTFINQLSKINKKEYPIVGPKIINPEGQNLNPFMISPLSIIQRFYWNLYFCSYYLSKILITMKNIVKIFDTRKQSENIMNNKEVYAVHGSVILFSSYFFQKGGWFDNNFKMYGEELTVAEIAKKINLPVTYVPQLKFLHHEHRSTGMVNQKSIYHIAKESHKYFRSTYNK